MMLETGLRKQVQESLLNYQIRPVEIVASLDSGSDSARLRELLTEIVSLSQTLTLVESNASGVPKPSFSLGALNDEPRIAFAGVPTGNEFTSLVLAILQVGGHPPRFDDALIARIVELDGDYRFETFVSLACPYCQEVVQALNGLAALNPRIRHIVIDVGMFQNEATARDIDFVPTIVMNGERFGEGRTTVAQIVGQIADIEGGMKEALRAASLGP